MKYNRENPVGTFHTFATMSGFESGKSVSFFHFYWNYPLDVNGDPKGLPAISDTEEVREEIRKFWKRVGEMENGVELE